MTKYCAMSSYGTVDNKTVLDLVDDAAQANWGNNWVMPTDEEIRELFGLREYTLFERINITKSTVL